MPQHNDSSAAPPTEITEALSLFWGAFALSMLALLPLYDDMEVEFLGLVLAVTLVSVLLMACAVFYMARHVRRRSPWARWGFLCWSLVGYAFFLPDPLDHWVAQTALEQIVTVVVALMEAVGCTLLFFGAGARWYANTPLPPR
jgi:hypothetical protein